MVNDPVATLTRPVVGNSGRSGLTAAAVESRGGLSSRPTLTLLPPKPPPLLPLILPSVLPPLTLAD